MVDRYLIPAAGLVAGGAIDGEMTGTRTVTVKAISYQLSWMAEPGTSPAPRRMTAAAIQSIMVFRLVTCMAGGAELSACQCMIEKSALPSGSRVAGRAFHREMIGGLCSSMAGGADRAFYGDLRAVAAVTSQSLVHACQGEPGMRKLTCSNFPGIFTSK